MEPEEEELLIGAGLDPYGLAGGGVPLEAAPVSAAKPISPMQMERDRLSAQIEQLSKPVNPGPSQYQAQISDLLQKLNQPNISPQDQERLAINRLLSLMIGGGSKEQILPGGVRVGGSSPTDALRYQQMMKMAEAPAEQAKIKQENYKDLLDAYMKAQQGEVNQEAKAASQQQRNLAAASGAQKRLTEIDDNLPQSQKSQQEQINSKGVIGGYVKMLDAFGKSGSKGQIPGYLAAAEELQGILNQVPNMSYNDQKLAQQRAKELVSTATGLRDKELDKMMVSIAGAREGRQAAETGLHLTKPQEKLNADINKINISIQKMNELGELKKRVDTGPVSSNVFSPLKNLFNMENADFNDLNTLVAQIANPVTKEFAGVAVSDAEWKRIEPMIPQSGDNDNLFRDKLARLKKEAERLLAERSNEYQLKFGQPIDQSKVAKKATNVSNKVEGGTTAPPAIGQEFKSPMGEKIRVRRKVDGKTGTVNAKDFDPAKYERL